MHYLSHQLGNQVGNSMDYAMDSMDTDNATQRLGVPLNLSVYTQYASAELQMPAHWQIVPDDETFNQLKSWVAPEHLTLEF